MEYLKKYKPRRTVIYCSTHRAVESVAAELEKKYPGQVGEYHSGLSQKEKTRQQIKFCSGEYTIMVATSAFGMGIDLPDIDLVLHFDMPPSMNDYIQQTGRAGRDGGKAHCILLYSEEDYWIAASLVEPYENVRLNKSLQQMEEYCSDKALSQKADGPRIRTPGAQKLPVLHKLPGGEAMIWITLAPLVSIPCLFPRH